jgi:hypothetical protein
MNGGFVCAWGIADQGRWSGGNRDYPGLAVAIFCSKVPNPELNWGLILCAVGKSLEPRRRSGGIASYVSPLWVDCPDDEEIYTGVLKVCDNK